MSATQAYQPPTETEAKCFFRSLPSQPKLIARTNSNVQPYQCLFRLLTSINDQSIIAAWNASVRQGLLNVLSSGTTQVAWNAFMPLRIHARPYSREPFSPSDAKAEEDNFLLVAVEASTTWQCGLEAALACRRVLNQNGIQDFEVAVVEMSVVSMTQPKQASSSSEGGSSPTSDRVPSQLPPHELFNAKFSCQDQHYIPQSVNEALMPVLPLPGQCLQPVAATSEAGAGDRPTGSLTCFLQLEDENGVLQHPRLALASRHVVVQDLHKDDLVYTSALNKDSDNEKGDADPIPVAWGNNRQFEILLRELKASKNEIQERILSHKKKIFQRDLSDKDIEQLRELEECLHLYIPSLLESLDALHLECNPGSEKRRVGNVIAAGNHGLSKDGAWNDWALITLTSDKDESNDIFHSNRVYIGDWERAMWKRVSKRSDLLRVGLDLLPNFDKYGFLKLTVPHPPMQTVSQVAPRLVFKRGQMTGLRIGMLSPIEAIIRKPLSGTDVVAWAWPVLSLPGDKYIDTDLPPFSIPGDSGSCVFDETGIILGMVDAGLGTDRSLDNDEAGRRLFVHHGGESSTAPVPVPEMGPSAASQQHFMVPPDFIPWIVKIDFNDGFHTVDVTLMTPIDWVLSDVKDTTGFIPRIV